MCIIQTSKKEKKYFTVKSTHQNINHLLNELVLLKIPISYSNIKALNRTKENSIRFPSHIYYSAITHEIYSVHTYEPQNKYNKN